MPDVRLGYSVAAVLGTLKFSCTAGNSRGWLRALRIGAATLIAVALIIPISAAQSKGKGSNDIDSDDIVIESKDSAQDAKKAAKDAKDAKKAAKKAAKDAESDANVDANVDAESDANVDANVDAESDANGMVCIAEGPVPGCIAEDLPLPDIDDEMAKMGMDMSEGRTNTPTPNHANQFAFETNELNMHGTDSGVNLNMDMLQGNGKIDVPTGAGPSPLFGAEPFTQMMLRFEEFGGAAMGEYEETVELAPFPHPSSPQGFPEWGALDEFISQYLGESDEHKYPVPEAYPYPFPTRWSNDPDHPDPHNALIGSDTDENPWRHMIEGYMKRGLVTPPAEGRPPGEEWAHQRWDEFYPKN